MKIWDISQPGSKSPVSQLDCLVRAKPNIYCNWYCYRRVLLKCLAYWTVKGYCSYQWIHGVLLIVAVGNAKYHYYVF